MLCKLTDTRVRKKNKKRHGCLEALDQKFSFRYWIGIFQ